MYWETILTTSFHSHLGQSTSVTRKSFSRDPSMPSLSLTCLIEDLGLPSEELLKDLGLWSKLAMSCLGPHTSNDGHKGKVSDQGKGPKEVDLLWSKSEEQCVNKCDQVKCSKNCCHLTKTRNESCKNIKFTRREGSFSFLQTRSMVKGRRRRVYTKASG